MRTQRGELESHHSYSQKDRTTCLIAMDFRLERICPERTEPYYLSKVYRRLVADEVSAFAPDDLFRIFLWAFFGRVEPLGLRVVPPATVC